MPRRRKTDFWTESLPMEMEWALGGVFVLVWVFATLGYYWTIFSRIERLLGAFAPLGVKPDEAVFLPILELGFQYAPFLAIPIAYRIWRWARQTILRSISGVF